MNYCMNSQCPYEDCEHHLRHAPRGFAVTTTGMDKTCRRYIDHLVSETEKEQRMREMTMGQAYAIFVGIDREDVSDEEKGLAIWKVLNMETHNGITKDQMLRVIRYLLGMCFELPGEGEYGKGTSVVFLDESSPFGQEEWEAAKEMMRNREVKVP